jgi:uncharacterized coiled-coil protein SlyX
MRQPLTLSQVKAVLASARMNPIDTTLLEMIPADLLDYIQAAPDVIQNIAELERLIAQKDSNFEDLNLALVEYANASGQGQLMMDNLKLCLDQVRMRKQQAGSQNTLGRQGRG